MAAQVTGAAWANHSGAVRTFSLDDAAAKVGNSSAARRRRISGDAAGVR